MTGNGEIDPVTLEQLSGLRGRTPSRGGRRRRRRRSGRWNGWRNGRDFPPCPPGWYPPNQAAFEELDRADLEAHPEVRQRMWEIWHDR